MKSINTPDSEIRQKVLKLVGEATGIVEPYNSEAIREVIFRIQLILPETAIQRNYYPKNFLLTFFYKQKQHFITVDDLVIWVLSSREKYFKMKSRYDFSTQMHAQKVRLIERCIFRNVMLLSRMQYNDDKFDFLLLPEFDDGRIHYIDDVDVFAAKIANRVDDLINKMDEL